MGSSIMTMFIVLGVLVMLPFLLFFGVVGLAIFIWCWNRIGRYFINFGRWLGTWRNFIPLSLIGILFLLLVIAVLPTIGFPRVLVVILLVLHLLLSAVVFLFALVAWTVMFCQWFWPRYRRLVWSALSSMWGTLPRGRRTSTRRPSKPSTGLIAERQPTAGRQQPLKRSMMGSFWALVVGRPPQAAKSTASAQPGGANVRRPGNEAPGKRSWFGTFWALMLGKPSQPTKQKPRPAKVQTTEQTLGPSDSLTSDARTGAVTHVAGTSAFPKERPKPQAKRSWFGSLWALMQGQPSKPAKRKSEPEQAKTGDRADRSTPATAAADAKTGASTSATTATGGEKPAKRGFFAGMWASIVRGITFVVGLVILAVLWVVQKLREGIEWIRVRLNLD